MIIAISATGPDPDGIMESRFGRAAGFVMFDTESGKYSYADNSENSQLPHAAGIQTAQVLADLGASAIISGSFGPKAAQALGAGGIRMVAFEGGTVRQAVEKLLSEGLQDAVPGPVNAGKDMAQAPAQGQGGTGAGCRRTGGSGMGMGRGGGRGMGGGGRF